jgi:hypothetical protein
MIIIKLINHIEILKRNIKIRGVYNAIGLYKLGKYYL